MPTAARPWERTAEFLRSHCRDKSVRNIGLEIERIGLWPDGYTLHYRPGGPDDTRAGAEQLLTLLAKSLGWQIATYSEKFPLGLNGPAGKVSLEPGSQLEFSANPQPTVQEAQKWVDAFEAEVDKITAPWGLAWIGLGVNPITTVEAMDVIPLTRYRIMTDYLGKRGSLGTTMMRLTSSIQINYDYSSEAEAISMLRTALAVAPVCTALFGNSPLSAGKPNGWLSFRSEVWRNTDPDRSGLMPEAFEEDFSFSRYAEMAWKRPLMFAQNKKGENVESHRRNLLEISLGQLEDCELNAENELNALRQLFTEARLKPGYVEVRSIDGLRPVDRYAAVAFWTGLMFSEEARTVAYDHLGTLSPKLRQELWVAAGREGMRATVGGLSMKALAHDLVEASRRSLVKRGFGEEKYLKTVDQTLADGKNPADRVLEHFTQSGGDMNDLFLYLASASA